MDSLRLRHLGLVAACLLIAADQAPSQQTAHLRRGHFVEGRLQGPTAAQLRFVIPDAPDRDLTHIQRIEVAPSSPAVPCGAGRRFGLAGGESISGQLLEIDRTHATVRFWKRRRQLPLGHFESLRMPADRRELRYEDFDDGNAPAADDGNIETAPAPGRPGRAAFPADRESRSVFSFPRSVQNGRVTLCLYDPGPQTAHFDVSISVIFASAAPESPAELQIVGRGERYLVDGAAAQAVSVQPLLRKPGWHSLALSCRGGRLLVSVDGRLLASGRAPPGAMTHIEFAHLQGPTRSRGGSERQAAADRNRFCIDNVTLQEFVAPHATRTPDSREQDVAFLSNGDELYGTLVRLDPHRLELESFSGPLTIPWSDLSGIALKRRDVGGETVSGWISKIELRSPAGSESPERIVAALRAADEDGVTIHHPLLGVLVIPWASVRTIEPRFFGRLQMVSPSVRHLGDEIRGTFRHPIPEGTEFAGRFSLNSIPPRRVFLALDVDQLEPSGTSTPPGSPFLEELRNGHLVTKVEINGRSLGTLNERISVRSESGRPQRIRIPVPPDILRTGENTFSLKQQRSRATPARYDDCEIARIALEFEPRGDVSPAETE